MRLPAIQEHGLNQTPRPIRPWVILLIHARAKSVGVDKVTILHAETIPIVHLSDARKPKISWEQTNGAETERQKGAEERGKGKGKWEGE